MDRKTHAVKRLMRFIVRQSIKGHENGALSFELERHLTSTDVIQRRPAVQRRRRLLLPAEQNRTEPNGAAKRKITDRRPSSDELA